MQGTPYERPAELGQRNVLSEQEFAQRQGASDRQAALDAEQVVVQRPRANAGTGPPSHWGERGTPSRQASLIVDPPDGRLPPMTEEGKKRIALARSTYWYDFPDAVVKHPFETFTDLGRTTGASPAACWPRCCQPATTWGPRSSSSRVMS